MHPHSTPLAAPAAPLVRHDVTAQLTLAGQPTPTAWPALAAEGFTVIINLRSDPERAAVQAQQTAAAGLHAIHLPLPAYELDLEHLATFHAVLAAQPGRVLLHCRSATRVALLWLLEKIHYAGWSQPQAEQALRAAGYDDPALETFRFCADDFFERAHIQA